MKITPPPSAYALVYFPSLVWCAALSVSIGTLALGQDGKLSGLPFYSFLGIGSLVAIFVTIFLVKFQWIEFRPDMVLFSFTRYCMPKSREAAYKDIRTIVFHDGVFGRDGKPRPYIEIEKVDGSAFWVPLSIFGRQDLRVVLEEFRRRKLPLKTEGRVKFIAG